MHGVNSLRMQDLFEILPYLVLMGIYLRFQSTQRPSTATEVPFPSKTPTGHTAPVLSRSTTNAQRYDQHHTARQEFIAKTSTTPATTVATTPKKPRKSKSAPPKIVRELAQYDTWKKAIVMQTLLQPYDEHATSPPTFT